MDEPDFDLSAIPRFDPDELDVLAIEEQLKELPHLAGDQRYEEPTVERIFRSDQAATAAETLASIPGERQAVHLVINGRFALWDFVPAILTLARAPIEQLHLATLGFSKKNIGELCALLDAGQVGKVALLCSHYFKGTSGGIYEIAESELTRRNQRFGSCRTHAKIVLAGLSDGRTVTIESSANLRSCHNIEQVVVAGDPGLYRFHASWMDSLIPCPESQNHPTTSATRRSKSGGPLPPSTESRSPTSRSSVCSAIHSPGGRT